MRSSPTVTVPEEGYNPFPSGMKPLARPTRRRRRWPRLLKLGVAVLSIAGCASGASLQPTLRWIRSQPESPQLIVFVSGFRGDVVATWLNSRTQAYWPDLIGVDRDLQDFDVLAIGYPSACPSLEIARARVQNALIGQGAFAKYREVYFVGHSMGGLIIKEILLDLYHSGKHDSVRRIRLAALLATPSQGAPVAGIAARSEECPQLSTLEPNSDYLVKLDRLWGYFFGERGRSFGGLPRVVCAYETQPLYGIEIVPRVYAKTECDDFFFPLTGNHSEVAKPESPNADSYVWLKNALLEARATRASPRVPSPAGSPRLSLYLPPKLVFVGRAPERVDDFVELPIIILNGGNVVATGIDWDLWYYNGSTLVSFKRDWYEKQNRPHPSIPVLPPDHLWPVPCCAPSVMPGARESYASGKAVFRAKFLLSWKDSSGVRYRYVSLIRLHYAPPHEGFGGGFSVRTEWAKSSIDDELGVERRWGPLTEND